MARVVFTSNLRAYTGGVSETVVGGATVREVLDALDAQIPGLGHYLRNDRGVLRRHVNVFVDGEWIKDRVALSDAVADGATVHVLQALSGG